jgi:hypothetical protein
MELDLWTFFVDQLFGGFWIAVFGIGLLIWLIIGVFGRLSKISQINYLLLYFMVMTIGYGYRWLTAIIGTLLLAGLYLEWKNYTSG